VGIESRARGRNGAAQGGTVTAVAFTPAANPEPTALADLGVDPELLRELALKTLFYRGRMTRTELAAEMKLSGNALEELLQALSQDGLTTVTGAGGTGPAGYVHALTQKGLDRAHAALNRSGYVGPAPVALREYVEAMRLQSIQNVEVSREDILRALGPLVLSDETVRRIGRAATSRRSTLVYGASGNGKTTAVRTIGSVVGGTVRIPYALDINGHIVHLFDRSKHQPVFDESLNGDGGLLQKRGDQRWVTIHRPVIWAGGELTKHSLELVYDDSTKVYEAPLQLKATGGTLIIDDFGRQQIPAVTLLNRWIVALEGGVDHLTMHTGQTVEVPFDVLVLFSTNLKPEALADEAFLRRIRYKVEVPNPTREEYRIIFRRACEEAGITYDDSVVTHLFSAWYDAHDRQMRGCHPRDLVEAIVDASNYESRSAVLSNQLLDEVCETYFLRPEEERD
jgi:predicted ATPase with chaperone activity